MSGAGLRTVWERTFRAAHRRNYRLFLRGQLVSMCGTWTQMVAVSWLALQLSDNSGIAVGVVNGLQMLPILLLSAWCGVLVDRLDKRTILIVDQTVMAAIATLLAVLTITGLIQYWMLCVLVLAAGCATALDVPARQAFVNEMVGPDDLPNAVGLNSALNNLSRIVGPAIAGVLIVAVGTGACFALNALSFVAVITALALMRPSELYRSHRLARAHGQVREGLQYSWHQPSIRSNLLLMAMVGLLAVNPFPVVLPVLAKLTFDGNAGTFSVMTIAVALGALAGSLVSASRQRTSHRQVLLTCVAFGVSLCLAALAPSLPLFLVVLLFVGGAQMAYLTSSNTLLQLEARSDLRGRVLALRAVALAGMTPLGAPLLGWICEHTGPRWGFGAAGVSVLAGALYYSLHLATRHRPAAAEPVPSAAGAIGHDEKRSRSWARN